MPPKQPSTSYPDEGSVRSAAVNAATWGVVLLAIVLAAYLVWQLRVVLSLVFLALLLAAAIRGPVDRLASLGLPRVVGVVVVYLVVLAVAALGVWLIVPPLVEQASALFENLPQTIESLLGWLRSTLGPLIPGSAIQDAMDGIRSSLDQVLPGIQSALRVPLVVAGVLVNVVLIIFLSIFLILDGGSMWNAFLGYFPPQQRERMRGIGETVMSKLGSYVVGQLVIMSATGVGAVVGMLIIGVPYALPLGFLAFVTEAIPLVGPWIGGAPIIAVAFVQGPVQGLLMAGWILLLQQVEGYVLVPFVQKKAIQVSPTIVLLAVVAGGTIAGVLGALIAIPIVAVTQVLMREVVLPARRRTWQDGETGLVELEAGSD
jgi:putative heme transporter